ncbi:MAG: peptide-methionine (S)-S-oxide reductase MsrA [Dehalococcoidia bacterium]|nr:peptide-methionine (S)-S-oxide reductase MsrA [Dehalococcoidia bacterium]MQG00215.1 peptide-methionine (S)-S-oxide reductase MsrA [SAR202 cluster bacterium]|tara:strand:+ start:2471 stop:3025 length:555 start_codon:yes stop_codon:yes gene_type:complete
MDRQNLEVVTLAGGCFWCLEAVFDRIKGVQNVESGYCGGIVDNPTYFAVCSGRTGHAEAIQVTFDTDVISYKEILSLFFDFHDPTTLNRQGHDVGTQYRSAIFFHTLDQKSIAEDMIAALDKVGIWNDHIVTEVTPLEKFYIAEDYHQEYYENNADQPYCQFVIYPKLVKLNDYYKDRIVASNL